MTAEETWVWRHLQAHKGQEQATTNGRLSEVTCLPLRRCRQIIECLVRDHHKPIAAHPSLGIFIALNEAEKEIGLQAARKHALSAFRRYKGLKLSRLEQSQQLELNPNSGRLESIVEQTAP
jgi:hypothetical protein